MIYKNLIIIFSSLICTSLALATSITELSEYPQFCQNAAENEGVFANFKRHPIYQGTLEHVSYELGNQYLNQIINEYPYLLAYFDTFRSNDAIGNPLTYEFGEYGNFSPTTMRYIKIAGDLIKEFGDLSRMNIVEIGAGYGGQCKILADLGMFASYTIIDLPQCNLLTRKFLDRMGVKNVELIDNCNLSQVKNYDLVVSNYAFSEIDSAEQAHYVDYVIDHTPNGFMLYNFSTPFSMPIESLITRLEETNRVVKVSLEEPRSNSFNRANVVLVWKEGVGLERGNEIGIEI